MFNSKLRLCALLLGICVSAYALAAASVPKPVERFELRVVPAVTDDYILPETQPGRIAETPAIRIAAAPGEYEPASFVIFANAELKALQIEPGKFVSNAGDELDSGVLDVRIVKRWNQLGYGARADTAYKYLRPELLVYDDTLLKIEGEQNFVKMQDGSYVLTSESAQHKKRMLTPLSNFPVADAKTLQPLALLKGENRQLWLTLHVPEDARPGLYYGTIELLEPDQPTVSLPVRIEVLPIALAEPLLKTSIYYRGVLDAVRPDGTISAEVKSEAQYLAEQKNMFEHGIASPTIHQKYSTGLLDRVLELRSEAGFTAQQIYYLGFNVVNNNDGKITKFHRQQMREVVEQLQRSGGSDVYLYGRDEAFGEGLTSQLPFWQAVRDAGAKMLVAGWQTTPTRVGNFDLTGGEEDLFVALGVPRRSEAERWHSRGRKIYNYQNPTGGQERPDTFRRNYGLLLWQKNYDGLMPYAYQDSEGRAWFDFDSYKHRDLNFTYPTVEKPIDTIQWEGLREGIDDLRYLNTLLQLLATAEGPEARAAQVWLADLKFSALVQRDLDTVRATMIAHILALQGNVAADSELSISVDEVAVSPVSRGGRVDITWRSDQRIGAQVEALGGNERYGWLGQSRMPAYEHAVTVKDVRPADSVRFRLVDGDQQVLANGTLTANERLRLQAAEAEVADGRARVSAQVLSDYEASVAIDWNRSLLGWWRFSSHLDDQVEDESSWGRPATLYPQASLSQGYFGLGARLNGAGAFGFAEDVEIPENGQGTVEGWFRFNSFAMDAQSNVAIFSGLYQHAENNHFYIVRSNDYFHIGDMLEKNVWHHLALSWDGDTRSSIMYVDGRPVPITVLTTAEAMPAIDGFSMGSSRGYFGGLIKVAKGTFDGSIDELRVWNRVLSDAEVRSSWRAGRNAKVVTEMPLTNTASWSVIGANAADNTLDAKRPAISP